MSVAVGSREIVVVKAPNKISEDRVVRPTIKLLHVVLQGLNYVGRWNVVFVSQVRNRTDKKFQVLRREGTGIRLKTKPEGNDSCWEIILSPPLGYVPDRVMANLRAVHPQKIFVKQATTPAPIITPLSTTNVKEEQQRVQPAPVETGFVGRQNSTGLKTCSYVRSDNFTCGGKPVEFIGTECACRNHVESPQWQEHKKNITGISPPKSQAPIPKTREVSTPVVSKSEPFKLEPSNGEDDEEIITISLEISSDDDALYNGLVAAAMVLNDQGRGIRKAVINSIISQLGLEEYIKHSKKYVSAHTAARALVISLCNNDLLSRYENPKNTTEGYVITPKGREAIQLFLISQVECDEASLKEWKCVKEKLGFNSVFTEAYNAVEKSQKFTGLLASTPQPASIAPQPTSAAIINKIASKQGELTALVSKHEKLVQDIKEAEELIQTGESEQRTHEYAMKGLATECDIQEEALENHFAKIQIKIDSLHQEISSHHKNIDQLGNDIQKFQENKEKFQQQLLEIKNQIKEIVT